MKKITSLFLVLCLLVSTVMVNSPSMRTRAVAEDSTDYVEPLVSVDEITSYLTYDMVEDEGHVQRLYAEESLDTLVFRNRDGTKTTYFFAEDIKFTDDEGYVEVKDISLEYTSSTGYTTKMNDKSVVLPNNISSGVSVSYGENTVTMIPMPNPTLPDNIQANANAELVTGKNSVRYNSVFGSNTHIEYTPLMNGVKEDIILSSYDGTNMWVFMINTNGMAAYTDENGMHYFAESEASDTRFSLGNVFIYDSADSFSIGTMQIAAVRPNQQYMVAISVDTEFLTDADTVYPVYIDPQITVSGTSSSNIQDTTVFSGSPSTNMGMWQVARVGCWGGDTSIARMLIKFPGLMKHSDFDEIINNSNALSVVLKLYQVEATDYDGIYIKVLKNSWTESNATWSNIDTDDTVGSKMIIGGGAAGYRTFDLTALFTNSSYSQYLSNGLVLKKKIETSDEGSYSFNTKECGSATSIPMVVVTYANVDMSIIPDSISMCVGEERDLFDIEDLPSGQTLYDCTAGNYTNITVTNDIHLIANSAGNATLTVVIQDAETGLLAFKDVPVTISAILAMPTSIELEDGQTFPLSQYVSNSYSVIWSSSDTYVANVTENGIVIARQAGTATISVNVFTLNNVLLETYSCNVLVYLKTGIYSFMNLESNLYMDVENDSTSTYAKIYQQTFIDTPSQQWIIEHIDSGYYTIKSENNNLYLTVTNNLSVSNTSLIRSARDASSTGQLWKISYTSDGGYKISAKCGETNNLCLGLFYTSTSNGTEIKQISETSTDNYDEWTLMRYVSNNSVEYIAQETVVWCWLACAKMFALNYSQNVVKQQVDVFEELNQEYGEVNGSIEDFENAVNAFIPGTNDDLTLSNPGFRIMHTESALQDILDNGHIVTLARGQYDISTNERLMGHMTVLYGYVQIGNDVEGNAQYGYLIRDPYPMYEGSTYVMSYDEISREYVYEDSEAPDDPTAYWAIEYAITIAGLNNNANTNNTSPIDLCYN